MKKFIYLAVFALSCSVLIFETVLLKFFNFKMMSSWAFLIVSIAFLGIGASGTYLALRTQDIKEVNFSFLFNFVTAYTVSIPLSIMLFAWFPYSPSQRLLFPNIIFSFFYLLLFSVPFFLSGICISYILSFKELPVGRVLFFDLLGASLGCICSVVFLRTLTVYGVLALSVGFAYLAAVIFVLFLIKTNQKTSFYGLKISLPIFSCVILLVYPHIMLRLYQIDILSTNRDEEHYKIFKEDFSGRGTTYWNPITRIDLSKEGKSDADLYLSGLSEKYRNKKYTGRYILLDSGGATRQFRIDGEEKNKEFLGHFLFSIPYHLNNVNDVLIIGPGGGLEILIGKYFKVRHIDAVDINSDIINILTGRNKNDRLRDIYSRLALSNKETTTVKYYVDDGRSFLSRKNAGFSKYDIVQLTNVDLLSTLTSGGMVLSESYLYTQEALRYYYDSLKENGYIQICYWAGPFGLRLFLTALEMLRTIKVERPENSLVVVGDMKWNINLLIKKGMFSDRELAEIRKICAADNFKVFFTPDMPAYFGDYFISESVNWFQVDSRHYCLASRSDTRKSLIRSFPYNINPTYDDKPFFYSIRTSKGYSFFTGVLVTLFQNKINLVLSLTGIALAFLIILLPLILKEIKAGYIGMVPFRHLLFFGITGLAFSLIEVIMIQKVAIFAGGPFYSMCLTLPTILIFYSLGAFSTVKIKIPRVWFLVISVGGIVLYGLLGYLFFDNVIRSLFYLRHLERIIFTVIIISPLGFFLGIPLSVVLEAVKGIVEKIITPWMWGVNSCGNVVGALFFVPIAHITGFNLLLMVSCFLYLVALCLLLPDTQTKFSK